MWGYGVYSSTWSGVETPGPECMEITLQALSVCVREVFSSSSSHLSPVSNCWPWWVLGFCLGLLVGLLVRFILLAGSGICTTAANSSCSRRQYTSSPQQPAQRVEPREASDDLSDAELLRLIREERRGRGPPRVVAPRAVLEPRVGSVVTEGHPLYQGIPWVRTAEGSAFGRSRVQRSERGASSAGLGSGQ